MQNYYLRKESNYYKYFNDLSQGCMDYILERCSKIVIPNIIQIKKYFSSRSMPVIYFKICSKEKDRSDIHHFFRNTYEKGKQAGYDDIYPLCSDPMADIIEELEPDPEDTVVTKGTFSPFNSTDINTILNEKNIKTLVFTGLATSQCVETTARDASDMGYKIIQIEDAQADYDELSHNFSLYASQGVCGGAVLLTNDFLTTYFEEG